MKKYILLFTIAILLASCSKDEAIYYDNIGRIYFAEKEVSFSFGDKALSYTSHIINVPVKVLGLSTKTDRLFKASVVGDKSTAIVADHYTSLEQIFTVKADSINAVIPLEVLRSEIEGEEILELTIEILPSDDFSLGVNELLEIKIKFNDFLEKPEWWEWFSYYLGIYQQEKYQKYIEIHGEPVDSEYVGNYYLSVLKEFKQVKDYFVAHPELGITFPDNGW